MKFTLGFALAALAWSVDPPPLPFPNSPLPSRFVQGTPPIKGENHTHRQTRMRTRRVPNHRPRKQDRDRHPHGGPGDQRRRHVPAHETPVPRLPGHLRTARRRQELLLLLLLHPRPPRRHLLRKLPSVSCPLLPPHLLNPPPTSRNVRNGPSVLTFPFVIILQMQRQPVRQGRTPARRLPGPRGRRRDRRRGRGPRQGCPDRGLKKSLAFSKVEERVAQRELS